MNGTRKEEREVITLEYKVSDGVIVGLFWWGILEYIP